ncbi:MAG TPA: hypothetical protein PKD55_10780 [Bellilinea sp.]|nr:hypothetical protein [Bellilinea sp.]
MRATGFVLKPGPFHPDPVRHFVQLQQAAIGSHVAVELPAVGESRLVYVDGHRRAPFASSHHGQNQARPALASVSRCMGREHRGHAGGFGGSRAKAARIISTNCTLSRLIAASVVIAPTRIQPAADLRQVTEREFDDAPGRCQDLPRRAFHRDKNSGRLLEINKIVIDHDHTVTVPKAFHGYAPFPVSLSSCGSPAVVVSEPEPRRILGAVDEAGERRQFPQVLQAGF